MADDPQEPRQRPPPPREPPPSASLLQTGGRVAEGIVGSFQAQPVMLLILVLNIGFLSLVYLGVDASGARRHQEFEQVLRSCLGSKEVPR